MKYKISSFCLSILMTFMVILSAQAQNAQTFSGVVLDEKNEPVIGASIKVVGAGTGTITDLDGKFSLSVPAKGKVEISYLGYSSQVISDFSQKEIILKEDALMLEETVVVGYGVQKKSHLTGAISTVALDDVKDLAATDLGSSLRGLVAGVGISGGEGRPGEQSRIVIRSADVSSSFSRSDANSSPLYVIDGFISTETEFNNLEPTMVESVSILKDGAAAVYGVRAGNGAVIVTTKRGEVGKPKVSYSGQFGVADAVSTPKMLSAYDYGKIWNGARAARYTSDQDATVMQDLFQADELEMMKGLNYDLLDQEWKAAFTQKHSVNIGGGTDNATYFAGISYNSQDGNLGKIKYERWNYRAGVDVKLNKWLKTSLQISGDYGENRKAYNKVGGSTNDLDYNTLLTRPRYIPDYIDGRPIAAYGPTDSEKPVHGSQNYHYGVVHNSDNHSETMNQNMFINSALEYDLGWNDITKGLKLKFTYSKSISTNKSNEKGTNYVLARMINRTGSGKHLYTGGIPDEDYVDSNFATVNIDNGNQLVRKFDRSDRYQMSFMASYQRTFGDHDISGLFGIEKSESELEDSEASKADPYSFTNGQSSGAFGTPNGSFGRLESGNLSYIGRVNYAYMNKYLVEFLIRSDASTKFAPSNYWGVFPSLSLGWTMSEEKWFRESFKGVNHMKLRGSIGLMGRDNIAAWQWRRFYTLQADKGPVFGGIDSNSGSTIGIPNDDINPNAHWDKSYKMNFGMDLAFLQNRLSATLEGYVFWDRDIFAQRSGSQVPSTVGARATDENYGKVNIYGGELSINWRDKIGKDFKYSIGVNTDYSDNKVLKMYWPNMIEIDGLHPGGRKDTGTWGLESIGMFRSYQDIEEYFDRYNIKTYLGLSKSDVRPGMLIYKDVRGKQNADGSWNAPDGVVDLKDDKVKISNRSNPYGLAVNLKAEWKALSFSAQISANWGGYGFVPTYARSAGNPKSDAKARAALSFINMPSFWANDMFVYEEVRDDNGNVLVEQNLNARYPNLSYDENKHASTFWKVSSARVALRNLTVAYTLPKQLINKIGVESCRVNFTGQNLLSFYNPYPDNFIDPLSGEYGTYPTLRRFTLGLNVSF